MANKHVSDNVELFPLRDPQNGYNHPDVNMNVCGKELMSVHLIVVRTFHSKTTNLRDSQVIPKV